MLAKLRQSLFALHLAVLLSAMASAMASMVMAKFGAEAVCVQENFVLAG